VFIGGFEIQTVLIPASADCMLKLMLTPEEQAAWNAHKRREMNRHLAWKRHARTALVRQATGVPGRVYNALEAKLAKLMDEAGIDYQWQFRLGRYLFDFLLPGRLLVEVHGGYWHADPRRYPAGKLTPTQRRNMRHDASKAEFAALCGYRVKVIWEQDLLAGRVSAADLTSSET
jgi:G:T-mismatch repair DNA endonuclease (very short patch repair protein)